MVEGDIPWILGRNTMKDLGMVIDIKRGEVRLKGERVECRSRNNDHVKIKLR